MFRACSLVVLCALLGCSDSHVDPLGRTSVSGAVTLDGAPVEAGSISFQPLEGTAQTASGAVITAGKYEIPSESGLAPGTYRVSISSPEPGPATAQSADDLMNNPAPPRKERVAAKFNVNSELTVKVEASGSNTFDFAVNSAG